MSQFELAANNKDVPNVSETGSLATPKTSARDRLALAIATIGVGYIPIVPATWASAVTTAIYWLLLSGIARLYAVGVGLNLNLQSFEVFRLTFMLVLIIPLGLAGVWAATRAERLFGRKDPKPIVIDEVVGQLITFLFLPSTAGVGLLIVGFFSFRAFDIFKPYPIRHLEGLKGGLGIVADDVLAGAYAAILMALLTYIPVTAFR
jgi:phosphatidylglycerophosphatase A